MICANPLAIQATAYWRNSLRLAKRVRGIDGQIAHMNAHATMQSIAAHSQFAPIAIRASVRCEYLNRARPVDAKIYAMPLKANNRHMLNRRKP